jgi:hypothetical protein
MNEKRKRLLIEQRQHPELGSGRGVRPLILRDKDGKGARPGMWMRGCLPTR